MAGKRNRDDSATMSFADKKIHIQLTALEDESQLSNWEMDFVSDISSKFYGGKDLHPNSISKLEEIYRRYN